MQTSNDIAKQAKGRWRGILLALGIDSKFLENRHGPCPICGGKDRYRFDDHFEKGGYFCSGCGSGDGFQLLMKLNSWNFPETARRVEEVLNGPQIEEKVTPQRKESDPMKRIIEVGSASSPVAEGDPVSTYLRGRGLTVFPSILRFHPNLYESETKQKLETMVAPITSAAGNVISLHRTYLQDGTKAKVQSPKKILPATETINGAAVRLFQHGECLGIAEGIETAIAAYEQFGIPVWSVISTNGIKTFQPPKNVKKLFIFADNDKNYAGQSAAYSTANKLSILKRISVDVVIPESIGDWLDMLNH
ncbi:MAG: hypothetical protein COV66_01780 [Nitrospinae bacterium CG11_big_fil_rev_8_21_14_0_20_45_15]|nr:MAG: hypothetical protein COV66_01780 [Nitrospinae bacterium CG11_big_fil_rev_8_21_14_0_20_45_15]